LALTPSSAQKNETQSRRLNAGEDEPMIVIEVDFNRLDGAGRLLLADLVVHERTPFAEIAASGERLLFVDGGEFVEGKLIQDAERGWVGDADWATQDRLRSYPPDRPALRPLAR
jgi:hypothetical protein